MMKRKETRLLVENWRRHLVGKKPVSEPVNEMFGFGKKTVDIKAMISNRLEKVRQEINDAEQNIIDRAGDQYNSVRVLNDLVRAHHLNIVRGQVLLFLAECLDKHDEIKIKGKFTEDMLDDLVTGNTNLKQTSFNNVIKSNIRGLSEYFNKSFDCSDAAGNDNTIRARSKWAKLSVLLTNSRDDNIQNFLERENLYKIVQWMIDNNK
jgi:hypothetical protein